MLMRPLIDNYINFSNKLPENLAVRVGSPAHRRGGLIIKVKRFFQHPQFNSMQDFDFSIYELVEPLNFTKRVHSIALPDANDEFPDGTLCRVSGWGNR